MQNYFPNSSACPDRLRECTITLALFISVFVSSGAVAQSISEVQRCNELRDRQAHAQLDHQWRSSVHLGRQYLDVCNDLLGPMDQSAALLFLGKALNELGQYQDAIPVLRRCISVTPNEAFERFGPLGALCWEELGRTNRALGYTEEAKKCYRKVIEIGAFDSPSTSNLVSRAKQALASLQEPTHAYGTGSFVSIQGHILTNDHVVADCKTITTRDGTALRVVNRNTDFDLALLRSDTRPPAVAVFRIGLPKVGDTVVAFGFPLPGLLSSEGNVAVGILSAKYGIQNDLRYFQISAPVQPGNSGGPLLDSNGHVIGVVVASLDAIKVAQVTGDIPQNINFAVQGYAVRSFLQKQGVDYAVAVSQHTTSTSSIAAEASRYSVAIDCVQ